MFERAMSFLFRNNHCGELYVEIFGHPVVCFVVVNKCLFQFKEDFFFRRPF